MSHSQTLRLKLRSWWSVTCTVSMTRNLRFRSLGYAAAPNTLERRTISLLIQKRALRGRTRQNFSEKPTKEKRTTTRNNWKWWNSWRERRTKLLRIKRTRQGAKRIHSMPLGWGLLTSEESLWCSCSCSLFSQHCHFLCFITIAKGTLCLKILSTAGFHSVI